MEHSVKFEIEIVKLSVVVHVLYTEQHACTAVAPLIKPFV